MSEVPKEYLKMADAFSNEMRIVGDSNNMIADDIGIIIGCYSGNKMAEHVLHAINSHDELVRQRDELLDVMRQTLAMLRVTSHGPSAANNKMAIND